MQAVRLCCKHGHKLILLSFYSPTVRKTSGECKAAISFTQGSAIIFLILSDGGNSMTTGLALSLLGPFQAELDGKAIKGFESC
jgi:hypothetical protein